LLYKYFAFEKKLAAVTRQDVMDAIGALKSSPGEAQHAFVAIRTMMNWTVAHGLLPHSPVPRLKIRTTSRSRILTDPELKAVWARAQEVGYPYGTLVQLLILTGQRRGEIASLRRSYVADDTITLPSYLTKNKHEHKFPIGTLTKAVLVGLPNTSDLYFPARGTIDQPINGWSKAKREFDKPLQIAPYTLHDLRRTFSSNLAKLGVSIQVAEKLLNHVSGTTGGIVGVYNRHSYWAECIQAIAQYEIQMNKLFFNAEVV
jgi:integrase